MCFTKAACISDLFEAVGSGRWRDMTGIVRLDDAALSVVDEIIWTFIVSDECTEE